MGRVLLIALVATLIMMACVWLFDRVRKKAEEETKPAKKETVTPEMADQASAGTVGVAPVELAEPELPVSEAEPESASVSEEEQVKAPQ